MTTMAGLAEQRAAADFEHYMAVHQKSKPSIDRYAVEVERRADLFAEIYKSEPSIMPTGWHPRAAAFHSVLYDLKSQRMP